MIPTINRPVRWPLRLLAMAVPVLVAAGVAGAVLLPSDHRSDGEEVEGRLSPLILSHRYFDLKK